MSRPDFEHISFLFADQRQSLRTLYGVEERHRPVGDHSLARTWNGRAVPLKPSFGSLIAVDLSNSGSGVWLPSMDRLQTGALVTLNSCIWQTAVLRPGETTVKLLRDPVEGVTETLDMEDETQVVPCTVDGRWVTIAARARHTTLHWRMKLQLMVATAESNAQLTGREQGWAISAEEVAP